MNNLDRSQKANHRVLVKLMKSMAVLLGSMTLSIGFRESDCRCPREVGEDYQSEKKAIA